MDVVLLSRLQFAAATYFHFLFVPTTLGMSVFIAVMESLYVRTGDEAYRQAAKFWGKIFLINFAVGIVTGITLEFQFGTNWARYSAYVGDIFGSLLAIEATAAFFLESTAIGVWIFGWNRLSPKAHAAVAWLVAGASNLSALWILTANAWMQHPVGYVIRNGRAELSDFAAVLTNPTGLLTILHVLSGAYVQTAFIVVGISAYHVVRGQHLDLFKRSLRLGVGLGLLFSIFTIGEGHFHAGDVAAVQPAKLAAMEAHWDTTTRAPMYLLSIPDPANDRNTLQLLPIPGLLSVLAFMNPNAEVKGLKDFPREDRPPVLITYAAFRLMVALGMLFVLLMGVGWLLSLGDRFEQYPLYLKVMTWAIPLPYLANAFGWTVTEVGRQPWIVYGVMRTKDAASQIEPLQVAVTFIGFILLYGLLGACGFWFIARTAKAGPTAAEAAATGGEAR